VSMCGCKCVGVTVYLTMKRSMCEGEYEYECKCV
jgi:hypothetical protein